MGRRVSYRWNAQTFASPGYVIVMINRRGSTGFGQKFTDDIRLDWGGKPFEDLMSGLDFVLGKYPFTDRDRVGAAGASYGGFMIDWMASHAEGRFRVLRLTRRRIRPDEHVRDRGAVVPRARSGRNAVDQSGRRTSEMSPHTYAAEFGKFKTPTLVIAGEQDYRVPYTQSLEFYSALQRQGVPSKLIVFPDEGHWILKPQNSAFWCIAKCSAGWDMHPARERARPRRARVERRRGGRRSHLQPVVPGADHRSVEGVPGDLSGLDARRRSTSRSCRF